MISWPSNRSPRLPAGFVAGTRSVISAMQSVGSGLAAWLDLAARCWLGQAFLARAAVTTMVHARLAMAGSGHWVDTFNDVINSPLGFAVQTACPLLLIFGLLSRPAALLLLIQALVLHSEEPSLDIYSFWGVLLGWFIVLGPGPLSLDALLGRGLDFLRCASHRASWRGLRVGQPNSRSLVLALFARLGRDPLRSASRSRVRACRPICGPGRSRRGWPAFRTWLWRSRPDRP